MEKEDRLMKFLSEHPKTFSRWFTPPFVSKRKQRSIEKQAILISKVAEQDLRIQLQREHQQKLAAISAQKKEEKQKYQREKMLTQAKIFLDAYKREGTLEGAGKAMGVTRERIRQVLFKFFPREYAELIKVAKQERKLEALAKAEQNSHRKCIKCGKEFSSYHGRKYCSTTCMRIIEYPEWVGDRRINPKNFTKDEWRQINTIRVKSYYQRNRERVNKQARVWQRANKDLIAIYQKRHNERLKYGHAITPIPHVKNAGATKA